jgi:hypothetical protein
VRAPEPSCIFVEIVSPVFDPNLVLLRRFFFANNDKSKYISVGFNPAQHYQPLVELAGAKFLPILLTSDYVALMAERLPALVESMRQNEKHRFLSEDEVFRMNSTGYYRIARVTLDKHYLSFKLHELRNLMYIL